MDDSTRELEDLEALIAAPGWERFKALVSGEWGSRAYRLKAQKILSSLPPGHGAEAGPLLLQLESSAEAVEGLFALLRDRINKLRHTEGARNEVAR